MAKNRWLLMAVAMMLTMHMSAQFPGGFGNFGQMAKRQAQQKAAEAEKNYQKGNEDMPVHSTTSVHSTWRGKWCHKT